MTKNEKSCAKNIICAQLSSDAGKRNTKLFDELRESFCTVISKKEQKDTWYYNYQLKSFFIEKAINIIDKSPRGMFNYFVEFAPDQNGYASFIIYFDFKVEDKRFQVSFHTPESIASDFIKSHAGKGRKTHWVGKANKNFTDPREACANLIALLANA